MTYEEARRAHDLADACDRLWPSYFGLTDALRYPTPIKEREAANKRLPSSK